MDNSCYNVTFENGYKYDKGQWQNSTSYGALELLFLAEAASEASAKIRALSADKSQHNERFTNQIAPHGRSDVLGNAGRDTPVWGMT